MEIKTAQEDVEKLILHYGDYWEPLSMLARLVEEVGELSRAMNIKFGGKKSKSKSDGREIEEELSDVLFTILAIANSQKIDIEKCFTEKIKNDYKKMQGVYVK
ncbi:MAG: MazG nucleotide pyrophosphohydrolase domain-containing protein [Candidatus Pacearchaeota archaeon]|jgi:NTP pyrophosphatase (non-canonical NTP hydrolase)